MSDSSSSIDASFRVIIIGTSGIGKSCFLFQFTDGIFASDNSVTVGVEYRSKVINLQNNHIKLQIWDTVTITQAGSESFRAVTRTFYRNSSAVVIMYDITKYYTFEDVEYWLDEARQHSDSDAHIYLVGNMIDLEHKREVKHSEAQSYAQTNAFNGFYEVSAKTGDNVNK